MLRRFAGIAVCLVLAGTWLMRAAETTPEVARSDEQIHDLPGEFRKNELQELLQIRRRLGGGVLKGTTLDKDEPTFENEIRGKLGLPQADSVEPAGDAPPNAVQQLRAEAVFLEEIASELEERRLYKFADGLRDSAKRIRIVGRQLDAPAEGGTPAQQTTPDGTQIGYPTTSQDVLAR